MKNQPQIWGKTFGHRKNVPWIGGKKFRTRKKYASDLEHKNPTSEKRAPELGEDFATHA